jgi:hypothetical protein
MSFFDVRSLGTPRAPAELRWVKSSDFNDFIIEGSFTSAPIVSWGLGTDLKRIGVAKAPELGADRAF